LGCHRQIVACPKNRNSVTEVDAVTFANTLEYPLLGEAHSGSAAQPGTGGLFRHFVEEIPQRRTGSKGA